MLKIIIYKNTAKPCINYTLDDVLKIMICKCLTIYLRPIIKTFNEK